MAGVVLALSRFHTAAVEALSEQSCLEFEANLSIPITETFTTKTSAVTAAWHEH